MTSLGTYYAIREKGTQRYLPERWGTGYTQAEPSAGPQPRLLQTERAAHLALTAWAKGRAHRVFVTRGGGGILDIPDEYPAGVDYDPVEGRSRDKMEIVPVKLVVDE